MGLSCFSRPAAAADSGGERVRRTANGSAAPSGASQPAAHSSVPAGQPPYPRQPSPVRSGLSSAAAAAAAATLPVPGLNLTAVAAAVADPVSQLLHGLQGLVSARDSFDGSGSSGGGALLSRASSLAWSAATFLSAYSDVQSDAGSWASGTAIQPLFVLAAFNIHRRASVCRTAIRFALSILA